MFLPLYVFCGSQLLVSYLRPSNIDGAKHSWAILSLLVKAFRKRWPDVEIVFRAAVGKLHKNTAEVTFHVNSILQVIRPRKCPQAPIERIDALVP